MSRLRDRFHIERLARVVVHTAEKYQRDRITNAFDAVDNVFCPQSQFTFTWRKFDKVWNFSVRSFSFSWTYVTRKRPVHYARPTEGGTPSFGGPRVKLQLRFD